jgi:hypothetical protein
MASAAQIANITIMAFRIRRKLFFCSSEAFSIKNSLFILSLSWIFNKGNIMPVIIVFSYVEL